MATSAIKTLIPIIEVTWDTGSWVTGTKVGKEAIVRVLPIICVLAQNLSEFRLARDGYLHKYMSFARYTSSSGYSSCCIFTRYASSELSSESI